VEPVVIPAWLLKEAGKDPGLKGRIKRDAHREAIVCDGNVVGFYTPHMSAEGYKRIGPIYVTPAYRGKGLVTSVYRSIEGPMMACVLTIHEESQRMHERAGFVKWKRFARGWYLRRE
jgi:L-amino acid N-acyltransferase YncA